MPDVVIVRVPKEEKPDHAPTPTWLHRCQRVLGLPLRLVRALLLQFWKRLFGQRTKP